MIDPLCCWELTGKFVEVCGMGTLQQTSRTVSTGFVLKTFLPAWRSFVGAMLSIGLDQVGMDSFPMMSSTEAASADLRTGATLKKPSRSHSKPS